MQIFKKIISCVSGATSLEFAILSVPLFTGILSIMELSYNDTLQSELDEKLYTVSQDIAINAHTANDAQEYIRDYFCPEIKTHFLVCDQVLIGVETVTAAVRLVQYRDKSVIGQWNLGDTGDTLLVEINYPASKFLTPIKIGDIVEIEGEKYYRSRGVIRREPVLTAGAS